MNINGLWNKQHQGPILLTYIDLLNPSMEKQSNAQ